MAFKDRVKQVLTDAAAGKYPVLIDTSYFGVDAVHDDYVELRQGQVQAKKNTLGISQYVRSTSLDDIKSIEPLIDWHIVPLPNDSQPIRSVTLADFVKLSPGLLDSLKAVIDQQGEDSK